MRRSVAVLRLGVVALVIASIVRLGATTTYVVDSTGDDGDETIDGVCAVSGGACTLRAAIAEANAGAGGDAIHFAIPGAGPHTITLDSQLPDLTADGVVVDGTTQPGTDCGELRLGQVYAAPSYSVVIDVNGITAGRWVISGDTVTVKGLEIKNVGGQGLTGYGLQCLGNGDIAECLYAHHNWGGVALNGTNGIARHNVTNQNGTSGITLYGDNNLAYENVSGPDAAGETAQGPEQKGLYIEGGDGNEAYGNLLSGNQVGFEVKSGVTNSNVHHNVVGLTRSGAPTLCNGFKDDGTNTTRANNTLCPNVCCVYDAACGVLMAFIGGVCADPAVFQQGYLYESDCTNILPMLRHCSAHTTASCTVDADCDPGTCAECDPGETCVNCVLERVGTPDCGDPYQADGATCLAPPADDDAGFQLVPLRLAPIGLTPIALH